jgi:hypothetical protein
MSHGRARKDTERSSRAIEPRTDTEMHGRKANSKGSWMSRGEDIDYRCSDPSTHGRGQPFRSDNEACSQPAFPSVPRRAFPWLIRRSAFDPASVRVRAFPWLARLCVFDLRSVRVRAFPWLNRLSAFDLPSVQFRAFPWLNRLSGFDLPSAHVRAHPWLNRLFAFDLGSVHFRVLRWQVLISDLATPDHE